MSENLSKLFKQAYNHPKTDLSGDVWRAIELQKAKNLKIQSLLFGFMGILSLSGFIFIFISMIKQFSSSGFFEYISLIFSDGHLLAIYWKEYLLSLVDSLPVASLGASFFLLFSMFISIRKITRQNGNQLLSI